MTKSPLQFARDFARLQSQLATLPKGDRQLLLMLDFWQEMGEYFGDAAYQSYFDEYLPLLTRLIAPANLTDLTIAELTRLRNALAVFDADKAQMVTLELAKQYFYVGAVEDGLAILSSPLSTVSSPPSTLSSPPSISSSQPSILSSPRKRGSSPSAGEILDSRFRGNNTKGDENDRNGDGNDNERGAPPLAVGSDSSMGGPVGQDFLLPDDCIASSPKRT